MTTPVDSSEPFNPKYCGGKTRGAETINPRCTRPAGWGTPHPGKGTCKLHGGKSPTSVRRYQLEEAAALALKWGTPIDMTPEAGILSQIEHRAGTVQYLREKVRELDDTEIVWGKESEKDGNGAMGMPVSETVHKAVPSVWVKLLNEQEKDFEKLCLGAMKAGIEERKIRIAESQGNQLSVVLRGFIAEVGLTAEQLARAPQALQRALDMAMGRAPAMPAIEGDTIKG